MHIESLKNRKVAITGAFTEMKRSEATTRLESLGAVVTGSVSTKTELLVAGARAGSKLAKAEKLGIEIWDEAKLIEMLAGSSVSEPQPAPIIEQVPSAFTGKKVVLTGTFTTMKRSAAKKVLTEAGAIVSGGVSKKTELLIHGEDAGSKLVKAQTLGIALMTEAQMVALLDQAGAGSEELDGAAEKMAAKEAESAKKYADLRKAISEVHDAQVARYGMTTGALLKAFLRLFAMRPDVEVFKRKLGAPSADKTLNRHLHSAGSTSPQAVPNWMLAFHAEVGSLRFSWAKKGADPSPDNGGDLGLQGMAKFRWWSAGDSDFETWQAQASVDQLQAEGSAFLSFDPGEDRTDAILVFDDANDCRRYPMGTLDEYLRQGAKNGFAWYWPSSQEGRGTIEELFERSVSPDMPEPELKAALVGRGASSKEASGLIAWLGDDVVLLVPS